MVRRRVLWEAEEVAGCDIEHLVPDMRDAIAGNYVDELFNPNTPVPNWATWVKDLEENLPGREIVFETLDNVYMLKFIHSSKLPRVALFVLKSKCVLLNIMS